MDKAKVRNSVDDLQRRQAKVTPVRDTLRAHYGILEWRYSTDPMDELVSCILSQNTTDANRDRGFYAMKERFGTWDAVQNAPEADLIDAIRPAGLANQKGPRIQRVLRRIYDERGAYNIDHLRDMPLDEARDWLVSFEGVGPKTAAIVLCFAFGRPAFPVDTHVNRVSKRLGMVPESFSIDKAHVLMEAIVPPEDHYAFHIYLIRHGRDTCRARSPQCERCPIKAHCDYYAAL